jgi:hypothetical protein
LCIYQIFLAYFNNNIIEGYNTQNLTYKNYQYNITSNSKNTPLEIQNANNISYLYNQSIDMSNNIANIQSQVNQLVSAQQQYADQMTGGSAPTITGAVDDNEDNTSVTQNNTSTTTSTNTNTDTTTTTGTNTS